MFSEQQTFPGNKVRYLHILYIRYVLIFPSFGTLLFILYMNRRIII